MSLVLAFTFFVNILAKLPVSMQVDPSTQAIMAHRPAERPFLREYDIADTDDLQRAESGYHHVASLPDLTRRLDRLTLRGRAAALMYEVLTFSYQKRCPYCGIRHDSAVRKSCRHRFRQDMYASLLVRGCESVYVLASEYVPPVGAYSEITIIHWPSQLGQCGLADQGMLELERSLAPEGLDLSKGAVRAVLEYWRENEGFIPFHTHVGTQAALLRIRHQDPPDSSSSDAAWSELSQYIWLVSNKQMVERMEKGKRNSSLYGILAGLKSRFPPGRFEAEVTEESMKDRMPNRRQTGFIRRFWLRSGQEESISDRLSKQPLYDICGRRNFQVMLSSYMKATHDSLKAVEKAIVNLKHAGWKFSEEFVAELTRLLERARGAVYALWLLMRYFPSVLGHHLEWLSQVADAENSRAAPCVLDPNSREALSEAGEDSATQRPPSTPNAGDTVESVDWSAENCSQSEDAFEHLAAIYTQRHHLRGQWANSALEYLHSICLYTHALFEAADFVDDKKCALGKIESRQIRDSTFVVVDVKEITREARPA